MLREVEKILFNQFQINHINIQPEYKKVEASKDFMVQD
jgi:cobalt-zinc-cadmium efflux system protein